MEQDNKHYKDAIEWLLLVIQNQKERIECLEKMVKEKGGKE